MLWLNENAGALTRPPAMCPLCQYSCPKFVKGRQDVMPWCHAVMSWRRTMTSRDVMTSYGDVTWRYDVMPWRHITPGVMTNWLCVIHPAETLDITFFQPGDLDLWPMTLTFELIRDIVKVNTSTKFRVCMSNGSAVRALTNRHTHTRTDGRTDTQTDGTDFIPSTAYAGGNNVRLNEHDKLCIGMKLILLD